MYSSDLMLNRNRRLTVEIFDDGGIGLEIVKESPKPNYKNGDDDYHEVYYNLDYEETQAIIDFLLSALETYNEKFEVKQEIANV